MGKEILVVLRDMVGRMMIIEAMGNRLVLGGEEQRVLEEGRKK
jgi:hypothetical protein